MQNNHATADALRKDKMSSPICGGNQSRGANDHEGRCAYICIYTHICIYMYTNVHVYIHIYKYLQEHIAQTGPRRPDQLRKSAHVGARCLARLGSAHCLYLCTYIYIYTSMHSDMYSNTHMCKNINTDK